LRVLLVDDSELALMLLERDIRGFLSEDDEIIKIKDSVEALRYYKDNSVDIDIVFTDLTMPKMNGIELLEKIKEFNESAKVVIVSAEVQSSIRQKASKLGAFAFFNKPIHKDDIGKILKG